MRGQTPAQRLDPAAEADLARRALRWVMEHKVYYDPRHRALLEPVSFVGRIPLCQPPPDIAVYLFEMTREVDLEAEHAR